MNTRITLLLFCLTIGVVINCEAQNVGINSSGAAPDASAGLDVNFTNKGFLAPRLTSAQKTAISNPATGLLIYQTNAPIGFYYNSGTPASPVWTYVGNSSSWGLTGNAGTSAGTNFVGTTDAVDLAFRTSNNERMRITSAGSVGIGTGGTAPAERLDVSGKAIFGTLGTNGRVKISNTDDSGISDIFTSDDTMLRISNNGMGQAGSSLQLKNSSENYLFSFEGKGGFRYYSRNTLAEKFRVNDGGDIYLTTTDQNTAIDAKGDIDDFYQLNIQNLNDGSSASSDIVATNDAADGNDYIDMGINSTLYDNSINGVSNILNGRRTTYLYGNGARMVMGNSARLQPLIFFTNSSSQDGGDDARGSERMRINSSGEVIVNGPSNGITNSSSTTDDDYDQGNYVMQVNGTIRWTNYSQASDRALKTNIEPLAYGLKDILALKPVKYNWIDQTKSPEKQIGLIAQELREVIPEIVSGDESKKGLGVEYTGLIPVLINAIKELKDEVNKQGLEIAALKAKNK